MLEQMSDEVYDCILPEMEDHVCSLLQLIEEQVTAGQITFADKRDGYYQLEGAILKALCAGEQAAAALAYIKGQARMLELIALGRVRL